MMYQCFSIYKETPVLLSDFLNTDLEAYIDLMPRDIKNEYLNLKKENDSQNRTGSDEEYIIRGIYNILTLEALRPNFYEKHSEVDLSDTIRNALFFLFNSRGIVIDREDRAGFALKDAGELEFYIWKIDNGIYRNISIGENKKWGRYKESILQLIGYMDNTIDFGFTIIFNQSTDLNIVREQRMNVLENWNVENEAFKVIELREVEKMKDVLVSLHENSEFRNTYFRIYHFIFNVYKPERKICAKKARIK